MASSNCSDRARLPLSRRNLGAHHRRESATPGKLATVFSGFKRDAAQFVGIAGAIGRLVIAKVNAAQRQPFVPSSQLSRVQRVGHFLGGAAEFVAGHGTFAKRQFDYLALGRAFVIDINRNRHGRNLPARGRAQRFSTICGWVAGFLRSAPARPLLPGFNRVPHCLTGILWFGFRFLWQLIIRRGLLLARCVLLAQSGRILVLSRRLAVRVFGLTVHA
jgi:hypothetical protein